MGRGEGGSREHTSEEGLVQASGAGKALVGSQCVSGPAGEASATETTGAGAGIVDAEVREGSQSLGPAFRNMAFP